MSLSRTRFLASYRSLIESYHKVYIPAVTMATKAPIQKPLLPHQPIPKLEQTIAKYLKSVEPFLDDCELNQTKKVVQEFQECSGAKLQKLLEAKAKCMDNWLAEWWLNVAYLGYRDPVVVFSSPGLVFPFTKFPSCSAMLDYAAQMISGALSYKIWLDKETMPVEMMGKDPLDMNQYNKIFGTCRIPGTKIDSLEYNPHSRHIIVVRNNNFFKINVFNECGVMIDYQELRDILNQVMRQSGEPGCPIGILTTDKRDNWGKAYQELTLDLTNMKSVRQIQTSLFLMCIDDSMDPGEDSMENTAAKQTIHGGGSNANSANRWYDKTIQFIVSQNGITGLTYEHSPAEGGPIAVMTDYVVDIITGKKEQSDPTALIGSRPIKLEFNVNEAIKSAIDIASSNIDKLACNLQNEAFKFSCYGKDFVKTMKMSPDSYIQMAMQYAFYRLHNVPGAHYESAATRKYIRGRTETIRSCSPESINFAKAMLDRSKSDKDRVAALQQAINAHKQYSVDAVNGFGCDRHLLGLKQIAIENNIQLPALYSDPSFIKSTHMRLSTSQVAVKCDGFMCYAPLVPDGYGCCYNPRNNDINFAVSSFAENLETSSQKFRKALEDSLMDMHDVLAKTQKSKL